MTTQEFKEFIQTKAKKLLENYVDDDSNKFNPEEFNPEDLESDAKKSAQSDWDRKASTEERMLQRILAAQYGLNALTTPEQERHKEKIKSDY